MEGCAMDKIMLKIRSEWDQAFRVYQDVNESHFRSVESSLESFACNMSREMTTMTREMATTQDMLREVLRRMERLERANNFQAMNGKVGEGQTVYIVDGSVNNFQQQNGNPTTCNVQVNPCTNPTPSPAEGLEQPKDMGVAQQDTSSTNKVSHQGHQRKVSQPNQRGLAFGTPCSGESLQHLEEAAEIHGARAKAAAANSSQQGLENEVTCSGGQDVVYSRDNVTSTIRNDNCRVEEIPTSQTVTIYDGDHTDLREPVVQSDSSNKFFCTYCPRQFQHKHSRSLHIRSCKKKHEDAMKRSEKAVEPQDNGNESCSDLAIHGSTPKKVGEILKKKIAKMIKCGHCERTFPTQHQVNSHERVHTGDRPFSCYICNIKFACGGNMIKHIKTQHPTSNPYVCRHCTSTFKTNPEIQNHRRECKPARNGVIRRRISEPSSDDNFVSRNNDREVPRHESEDTATASEREVPRHESEDTATASESEDGGSSQDRQIVPMATTNPGYSNFTPQPVPMLDTNLNDTNNGYNEAHNAYEGYNPSEDYFANEAYNEDYYANDAYNANNAYPNGAFHSFPVGSSIRLQQQQYTATQTYQCQSATGSPLVREITVKLCHTQTTEMPNKFQ